jgi:protein-tyrosine-phosphatase
MTVSRGERFPSQVSEVDLAAADRIIALDGTEHRGLVRERCPRWAHAVEYWSVHDLGQTPAESALAQIERHVRQLIRALEEG